MNRISSNFLVLLIVVLLTGCKGSGKSDLHDSLKVKDSIKLKVEKAILLKKDDSIELTGLVRKLYKWHVTDTIKAEGFRPEKRNTSDTLYTSIDLEENKKARQELKQTGFFSDDFLNNYLKIALRMDTELRNGKSTWREGELPTFNNDVDEWCNCQDYPDYYWEKITLTNIKFNNDQASFNWTWGDNFNYRAKAKKEHGFWKISYLEGFDINKYNWDWVAKTNINSF